MVSQVLSTQEDLGQLQQGMCARREGEYIDEQQTEKKITQTVRTGNHNAIESINIRKRLAGARTRSQHRQCAITISCFSMQAPSLLVVAAQLAVSDADPFHSTAAAQCGCVGVDTINFNTTWHRHADPLAALQTRLAQQPGGDVRDSLPVHTLADNADTVSPLLTDVLRLAADLVNAYNTEIQPWAAPLQRTDEAVLDATSVVPVVDMLQGAVDAAGTVSYVHDTLQQLRPPPVPVTPSAALVAPTGKHWQATLPAHFGAF